jgi:site-specific DNA-cytosine methylase
MWFRPTSPLSAIQITGLTFYGIDLQFVTGGPPCQPFSLGGKHKTHSEAAICFLKRFAPFVN